MDFVEQKKKKDKYPKCCIVPSSARLRLTYVVYFLLKIGEEIQGHIMLD